MVSRWIGWISELRRSVCQNDTRRSVACAPFFFFQAEDGIRDLTVTGVQTCALPIFTAVAFSPDGRYIVVSGAKAAVMDAGSGQEIVRLVQANNVASIAYSPDGTRIEIGRASCRERG